MSQPGLSIDMIFIIADNGIDDEEFLIADVAID
jgi:hypothetical protein